MIDLLDIRYVRLGTRDPGGPTLYAREVIGLERVRVEAGAHYYRSDDRDHTLVYFEGDPREPHRWASSCANPARWTPQRPSSTTVGWPCGRAAPRRWNGAVCAVCSASPT